jgi:hypothetical protein
LIDRTASAKVVLVRVTGANSYGCRMQMRTSKKPPRAGGVQGEKGCVDSAGSHADSQTTREADMMTERPMMDRGPCSVSTLSSISTWQLPDASDCKFPRSPACRVSAPSFGPPETSGLAAECSSQPTSSKPNKTKQNQTKRTTNTFN